MDRKPDAWRYRDAFGFWVYCHASDNGEGPTVITEKQPLYAGEPPANIVWPWASIPPAKRFGRRLTWDAAQTLEPGTLLRFYSDDPWLDTDEHMPENGEIVQFTGNISREFPKLGPHLEVAKLGGVVYPGGGWVYDIFQFVSDPPKPELSLPEGFAALAVEFAKPQFMTTCSGPDGRGHRKHTLEFSFIDDEGETEGRDRRDALHNAMIAAAKAVNP